MLWFVYGVGLLCLVCLLVCVFVSCGLRCSDLCWCVGSCLVWCGYVLLNLVCVLVCGGVCCDVRWVSCSVLGCVVFVVVG